MTVCLFFHVIPEEAPGGVPRRAGDVFLVRLVLVLAGLL